MLFYLVVIVETISCDQVVFDLRVVLVDGSLGWLYLLLILLCFSFLGGAGPP